MRTKIHAGILGRRVRFTAALCLALAGGACSIHSPSVPNLFGPSTLAMNIAMTAVPDVITADNVSRSVVTVLVRDTNGAPKPGVPLAFEITEAGSVVGLGNLDHQTATTDGHGYAVVVYTAPARTDVNNQIFIQIGARAMEGDANGTFYHSVTIELRPAEPSQFPQVPGLSALTCNFLIEPALPGSFSPGLQVLFQDASSDPNSGGKIIRYQWNFGDGTIGDDSPDVNHAYSFPGMYTVTHVINDNLGEGASCSQQIDVQSVSQGGVPQQMGAPKRVGSVPKRSRP
jgi:hypothetical protein